MGTSHVQEKWKAMHSVTVFKSSTFKGAIRQLHHCQVGSCEKLVCSGGVVSSSVEHLITHPPRLLDLRSFSMLVHVNVLLLQQLPETCKTQEAVKTMLAFA